MVEIIKRSLESPKMTWLLPNGSTDVNLHTMFPRKSQDYSLMSQKDQNLLKSPQERNYKEIHSKP